MNRKAFVILDLILILGVIAVTAGIVTKAISTSYDDHQKQVCARNLQMLAASVAMYSEDFESRTPINRYSQFSPGSSPRVYLPPESGDYPCINYVSALEPYLPGVTAIQKRKFWRCPAVEWERYTGPNAVFNLPPVGHGQGYVTYIINFWMLEINAFSVRVPGKTVLFRENGCVGSAFAFGYVSSSSNAYSGPRPPNAPLLEVLLTSTLNNLKPSTAKNVLHGSGSHLLMMDGHVALLSNAEMQEKFIKSVTINGYSYRYLAANETSTDPIYWISP